MSVEQLEPAAPRIVCEIRSIDDLHTYFRHRAEEIDVSRLALDAIAGLSAGYCSSLLEPKPLQRLTLSNVPLVAGAMALRLVLVEDPADVARMQRRWTKRTPGTANTAPIAVSPWERAGELRREQCSKAGKIRMKQMSKPERIAFARK